ncbi:MAG: hypothetical protein FJ276_17645 [Planctomycetes bacterium]|nr:hypothetical protein [Planctomycetota bacterium]
MSSRKASKRESSAKLDAVLDGVRAFNEAAGGGVVIRRQANGISLFREDNGRPIARLRPAGEHDAVEVLWGSHREKWEQIGDFGPRVMPLDEAFDFIFKKRIGVFWD